MTEAVRLLQKFMDSCLQRRRRDAMLSYVPEDICGAGKRDGALQQDGSRRDDGRLCGKRVSTLLYQ